MRMFGLSDQRGDTIVEVLLASAVLSLVLAGVFTLTNRATRLNQTANERTVVSNLMQREIELIQASAYNTQTGFWPKFEGPSAMLVGSENINFCELGTGPAPIIGKAFYMTDPDAAADPVVETGTDLLVRETSPLALKDANPDDFFDIWVEAVDGGTYVDFFVYACWEGIGGEALQNSGLVLRLVRI